MSYMRGDLLAKTRKLVKGFAKAEPVWKPMEKSGSTCYVSRPEREAQAISLPEDTFVNKFFQKHPDSKFEDAIKYFALVPFASRFLLPYIPWVGEVSVSAESSIFMDKHKILRGRWSYGICL
ncbi:UNVERIFIED_CONTAM: hypothetical protein Sradi_0057900 [Sesamum radiatum]|uniref:Small ribosomal subunit protein mS23 n=1 Tax=Sesamum radiatum TaxID=300843 RepID=A0AAW2WH60_SESRA